MQKNIDTREFRALDQKEMGKRVRSRRESLGLSREKLSEYLDVSPQFIADIEYGNKGISIKRFYLLCQVLDVTADYLLAGKAVVLNMEGIHTETAQRIIDFTSGSTYSMNGNLQKISNYIFIATPQSVELSGDFQDLLTGGNLDVSGLNIHL